MKSVQFLVDFNAVDGAGNSYVKFRKGETYPLNDDTAGQVAAGYAQEVDSPLVPQAPTSEVSPAPEAPGTVTTGNASVPNATSTAEPVAQIADATSLQRSD